MTEVKYIISPEDSRIFTVFADGSRVADLLGIDRLVGRRDFPLTHFSFIEEKANKAGLKLMKVPNRRDLRMELGGLWHYSPTPSMFN